MKKLNTAIIIVNHNNKNKIIQLIESIYNYNNLKSSKIIFIQNKPSNFIKNYLKNFKEVIFIENKKIQGFSKNINDAIHLAQSSFNADYFLLLNPDIILKNNILSPFTEMITNDSSIGIIGPKLLNENGTIQYSCRRFYNLRYVFIRMFRLSFIFGNQLENQILMKDFNHNEKLDVDWISGAAMFFNKEFLNKVGMFDDKNYFMYGEDQDLCLRSWRNDLKVIYNPNVECYHSYARRGSSLAISKYSFYQLLSTVNMFKKFNFRLKR